LKRAVQILLFWLTAATLWSEPAADCCGLLFQSYQVAPNLRTSLALIPNSKVLQGAQDLEFEVSFWDPGKFGYIFRAADVSGRKLDLLYTPEEFALKLILNEKEVVASVPFDVNMLLRNRWHRVRVRLGPEIGLSANQMYQGQAQKFEIAVLDFGVNERSSMQTSEVLPMAVREVFLKENEVVTHHWPLNEQRGPVAHDQIGDWDANVRNASWLGTKHSSWEQRATIEADYFPAISFDSSAQSIFVFNKEHTQVFNLHNNQWLEQPGHGKEQMFDNANYGIYNMLNGYHYLYDAQPRYTHRYQAENSNWLLDSIVDNPLPYRWKHVQLINPADSALHILGGYGYFESRNSLLKLHNQRWKEVPLKGDVLDPRYHLSAAHLGDSRYYLFGGVGNASGNQELGFKNYYDLHLLDFTDHSLTKIVDFEEPQEHFLPASNMVYHQETESLYTLASRNFDTDHQGITLLKLDVENGSWILASDTMRYDRPGVDRSDAYLWYNLRSQELIAVVRLADDEQSSVVTIYSLNFPPSAPLPEIVKWGWAPASLAFLFIAFMAWLATWRVRESQKLGFKTDHQPKATLQVLGSFRLVNAAGKDLSKEFSPKLQELLVALLIARSKPQGGIDTQTLTDWIWPDLSPAKAKNSRGVNFKRLREALSEMPLLSIVFENELWKLKFDQDLNCDFLKLAALKQVRQQSDFCGELVATVKEGPLLPQIASPWLESQRAHLSNEVIDMLLVCAQQLLKTEDYAGLEKLSETLLKFDDLSEEGLRLKLLALIKTGKSGVALQFYESFAYRYEKLLGTPLKSSFQEITS